MLDRHEGWTTLRAGVLICVTLLLLAACGGGSSASNASPTSSSTAAAMISTATTFIVATPVATPTAKPTVTASPAPSPRPTSTPSPTATSRATLTPQPSPTPAASPTVGPVAGSATPEPTDKVKALLAEGVTSEYQPVKPTTVFSTDASKIYLVFTTTDLPDSSTLDAVWIAVKVDADVTPNYEIDRAHLDVHGSQSGDFSLTSPGSGFPAGSYKVDLLLNGTLIGSYPFEVK